MKYPVIPHAATLRIASKRIIEGAQQRGGAWRNDLTYDLVDAVQDWGEGGDFDTETLEQARHDIEALLFGDQAEVLDRDQLEGKAACLLYRALVSTHVETATLDDPGFWRYVSLAHLWNFVAWREPAALPQRHPRQGLPSPGRASSDTSTDTTSGNARPRACICGSGRLAGCSTSALPRPCGVVLTSGGVTFCVSEQASILLWCGLWLDARLILKRGC